MGKMDRHLLILTAVCLSQITNAQMGGDHSASFSPEEQYLDMFPLTLSNFTESVMNNKDAWIVIFHDGSLKRSWKSMAVNLRGVVWIGLIDTKSEEELLEKINYKVNFDPEARVYPHGPASIKKKHWKAAKNPNEAHMMSTDSIPDKSLKLKGKGLQDFLVDCYMSTPSRFPVFLLTEEQLTPKPYKALSNRFDKYFNFGRFVKPTLEDYKALGMQDHFMETPLLFVLITDTSHEDPNKQTETTHLGFNAVQFDSRTMGGMTYPNIMKFLFAINHNYRHTLPGNNKSNQKEIAEMSDIVKIEGVRFDLQAQDTKNYSLKREPAQNPGIKLEPPVPPEEHIRDEM